LSLRGKTWHRLALWRLKREAARLGFCVKYVPTPTSFGELTERFEIIIDSSLPQKERIVYLLHELGHATLSVEGLTETRYTGDFDVSSIDNDLRILDEEFEAWALGREIAGRLRIPLDETYETAMRENLMLYVERLARHVQ